MSTFFSATRIVWDGELVESLQAGLEEVGASRPAILIDAAVAQHPLLAAVTSALGPAIVEVRESGGEPETAEADERTARLREAGADAVIGIGGGSVLDLSKALAGLVPAPKLAADYQGFNLLTEQALPVLAVPTTAGTGSEVTGTAVLVNREKEMKLGINSPMIVPRVAVLEPQLTVSIPTRLTLSAGMDALSHATESFSGRSATVISRSLGSTAFDVLSDALPRALADGTDLDARRDMLLGATIAGLAVMNAGTGAAHAMAYPLGVHFGVPHSEALTMLLPAIARSCEAAQGGVYDGLGTRTDEVSTVTSTIVTDSGEPFTLGRFGVTDTDLALLAKESMNLTGAIQNHPVEFTESDARRILEEIS